MAEGKWISGIDAMTGVREAARQVLAVRLAAVRDWLPRSVLEAHQDPENVHQLRVSTRRAAAALRIFRTCLPNKTFQVVRQRLRRLRRAAGEARDWDVFLIFLTQKLASATVRQRPGFDFLLGACSSGRAAAQQHLLAASAQGKSDPELLTRETLEALSGPGENHQTLGQLAGPHLTALVRELDQAASVDLQAYEHLHRVRILGKRLRYAMEVFAGCYDDSFRKDYYPAIVAMQDILGDANDSFTAAQRLTALREFLQKTQRAAWKRLQPGIDSVLRHHRRRLPQQRRKFERWWRGWQESGAEAAFDTLVRVE